MIFGSFRYFLKNQQLGLGLRNKANKRQQQSPLHMVSAWATKNRLMLAQVKTEEKSNEITAIPKLLKLIYIGHYDVAFHEDLNQSRIGHSAHNLAIIRRIALNLLKQESTHKNGIACRRKTAGWEHAYLLKVLTADQKFQQTH